MAEEAEISDVVPYSYSLSTLALCGTAGFGISRCEFEKNPFVATGFTLLLGHGMLGALVSNHKVTASDWHLNLIYEFSTLFIRTAPIALFNAQLGFEQSGDYLRAISYFHIASPFIPVISDKTLTHVMIMNCGTLCYFSYIESDFWHIALATLYAINNFVIYGYAEKHDYPVDGSMLRRTMGKFVTSLANLITLGCITLRTIASE